MPPEASPTFPRYLLPTLRIPFRRRRTTEPASSPRMSSTEPSTPDVTIPSLSSSPSSASPTSPDGSHPSTPSLPGAVAGARRLSRTHPTTLRCRTCSADLAFHTQIVSKGFMGRHGRAYLVAGPGSPTTSKGGDLINIRVGPPEDRQLVTGAHVVADISCIGCNTVVGWKYVDARDPGQQYKVGKFILETRRVVGFHSWEDVDVPAEGEEVNQQPLWVEEAGGDGDVVVFDSDDDEECEDIFAAVWDPKVVARRRKSKVVNMRRAGEALA
ncbi:hypothetical protein VTK26DRAFT_7163 [Humicola hyalothermophila]